jgi:hypothetical protein
MSPLTLNSLALPQILRFVFAFLLTLALLAYVIYQSRNLLAGPRIELTTLPEIIQHERTVRIEGMAENTTALTMNGRPLFTDAQGNFSHTLVLENGYTIMTLAAQDRYGRVVTLSRSFVYVPETSS